MLASNKTAIKNIHLLFINTVYQIKTSIFREMQLKPWSVFNFHQNRIELIFNKKLKQSFGGLWLKKR